MGANRREAFVSPGAAPCPRSPTKSTWEGKPKSFKPRPESLLGWSCLGGLSISQWHGVSSHLRTAQPGNVAALPYLKRTNACFGGQEDTFPQKGKLVGLHQCPCADAIPCGDILIWFAAPVNLSCAEVGPVLSLHTVPTFCIALTSLIQAQTLSPPGVNPCKNTRLFLSLTLQVNEKSQGH